METLQGSKYAWILPQEFDTIVDQASKYKLSIPLMHTLTSRGITTKEDIDSFLFSAFEKEVHDTSLMKDADKAVKRILEAIENGEKILVAGDYDVDGITSSALMLICLLPLGANINFFLPNRVKDGYGLSPKVVQRAADNDYKVIITVDNGITAFEPAELAKKLGVDLIITDHHRPHDKVPDAFAIVDPAQNDCEYPFKYLAGVGVTFKILSLLYAQKGLDIPEKAYELLLFGTVADVVPLKGENRFWVRHGLNLLNQGESFPVKVMRRNSKLNKPKISASDIGFFLAPQLNALGRLDDARQGVKFLIGADHKETEFIGSILLELNDARREVERSIVEQVEREIKSGNIDFETENVIMAAGDNWPAGVIGLVASRMISAHGKPALLFHLTKDGQAKGSCRSIPEFNMFDALTKCKDLLTQFGGHSLAAGLSLPQKNLPELKKRLEALVAEQLTPFDLQQKITLDAPIILADLNKKFMHDMGLFEPFGNENRNPSFLIRDVTLVEEPRLLKDLHVKFRVFADGVIKPVMFFNRPELFEQLRHQGEKAFDLAAQVTENYWNGTSTIELIGIDIAFKDELK
ncbi:single-stranded-DNA-specific exonuclease RecJ [bacterium]|jgi:single-stranded-DNA-specific exonuclease|nr:single-stranded-DNA-specific exonuclease RecJ [bacterium]MBT5015260.1 single-stranded-DNA-specific exonuclease RecJ [bacterium]